MIADFEKLTPIKRQEIPDNGVLAMVLDLNEHAWFRKNTGFAKDRANYQRVDPPAVVEGVRSRNTGPLLLPSLRTTIALLCRPIQFIILRRSTT